MINNFDRTQSPNSIQRPSIFRSSIEPNEMHFRSHRHGHLYGNDQMGIVSVSYTHLTLPTIYSV